jgi:hypothetical protein
MGLVGVDCDGEVLGDGESARGRTTWAENDTGTSIRR